MTRAGVFDGWGRFYARHPGLFAFALAVCFASTFVVVMAVRMAGLLSFPLCFFACLLAWHALLSAVHERSFGPGWLGRSLALLWQRMHVRIDGLGRVVGGERPGLLAWLYVGMVSTVFCVMIPMFAPSGHAQPVIAIAALGMQGVAAIVMLGGFVWVPGDGHGVYNRETAQYRFCVGGLLSTFGFMPAGLADDFVERLVKAGRGKECDDLLSCSRSGVPLINFTSVLPVVQTLAPLLFLPWVAGMRERAYRLGALAQGLEGGGR